jgi:hypothetical protein
MDDWSSAKLGDVANLVLGMILFFSPWLFGLSAGAQWQTASIIGIFIAVSSIAALAAFAVWEEWLNLGAGLTLGDGNRCGDWRDGGGVGGCRCVACGGGGIAGQGEPRPVPTVAPALMRK